MERAQGFAQQGARIVWTAGHASATLVQETAPFATITVFLVGTTTLATLYSDNQIPPTPMGNPFTANADGYWFFYAIDGHYDVMITAEQWQWTIGDLLLGDQTRWSADQNADGHWLNNLGGISLVSPNGLCRDSIYVDNNCSLIFTGTGGNVLMSLSSQGDLYVNSLIASPSGGGITTPSIELYNGSCRAYIGFDSFCNVIVRGGSGNTILTLTQNGNLSVPGTISSSGDLTAPNVNIGNCIRWSNAAGAMTICIDSAASLLFSSSQQQPFVRMTQQGLVESTGMIRVINEAGIPASGSGLELAYQTSPQLGIVQAYDRSAAQWIPLVVDGIPVQINSNSGGNVTMCLAGGNVGVNVANPQAVFEASGTIRIINDLPVPGPGQGLELGYQISPPNGIVQCYDRSAGQWLPMVVEGNPLQLNTNNFADVEMCLMGGNVGIGAYPNSSFRLDVAGDIHASGCVWVGAVSPIALCNDGSGNLLVNGQPVSGAQFTNYVSYPSRVTPGDVYQNTTGKPVLVAIEFVVATGAWYVRVDAMNPPTNIILGPFTTGAHTQLTFMVLPGYFYMLQSTSAPAGNVIVTWNEWY